MMNNKHTIPVTAVIENNGEFLFIKRSRNAKNMAGKWVFPGGKCEKSEDVIGALYRELKEETGLSFTNDIAFLSAYHFSREEDNSSSQGLVFLVRSINRNIKENPSCEEYRWIKPEEIVNYNFSYKNIKDFDKQKDVTIPGMEVHVRNALIILKRNLLLDKRLFSVTEYQDKQCTMDKDYFKNVSDICEKEEQVFEKINYFPTKN